MLPQRLGRYEIVGEIARGGMATVYLARDARIRRDVALKVLPREFLHEPTFRRRFEREAQVVASLEHPAIVPVYDYGEEAGQPYLAMRYMAGGTLADRLKHRTYTLGEAAELLNRLAPALDAAHARGIVHRDLKPGNILFDQNNLAYLSDFGLVRLAESSGSLTGGVLGTPAYMSPEQARGDPKLDGRSDVYALGIILFELLTGRPPYSADTPIGLAVKHVTEPVPRIRALWPTLPPAADTLIARALAKNPADRFQSATELAANVSQTAGRPVAANVNEGAPTIQLPRATSPAPATAPRSNRRVPVWVWALAGTLGLACVAGGWLAAAQGIFTPAPATTATMPPRGTAPPVTFVLVTIPPSRTPAQPSAVTPRPAAAGPSATPMASRSSVTPQPSITTRPTATRAAPSQSSPAGLLLPATATEPATLTAGPSAVIPTNTEPPTNMPAPTEAPPTATPPPTVTPPPTATPPPTNTPAPTETPTPTPPPPTNTPADSTPPTLSNFRIQPRTVRAGSCTVRFTVRIADASGVAQAEMQWAAFDNNNNSVATGAEPMTFDTGTTWAVSLAVTVPAGGYLDWSVMAADTAGNATTEASSVRVDIRSGSCP